MKRARLNNERKATRKGRSADDIRADQVAIYGDLTEAKKKCPDCADPKPLSEFGSAANNRDGLRTNCKEHRTKKEVVLTVPAGMKKCIDCDEPKLLSLFGVCNRRKDKRNPRCLEHAAVLKKNRQRKANNKRRATLRARSVAEIRAIQIELYTDAADATKQCRKCKKDVLLTDFGKDFDTTDGLKYKCKTCAKEKLTAWRESNKSRDASIVEAIQQKKYPDGKKACGECKEKKGLEEFSASSDMKDGLSFQCKVCVNEYGVKRNANLTTKMHQMKAHPCAECKEYFPPAAMDFAHLPGTVKFKSKNGNLVHPGKLGSYGQKNVKAQAEFQLTRLLCANCHAIETHTTIKHKKPLPPNIQEGYDIMNAIKRERGQCIDCKRPVVPGLEFSFDFDHRPGEVKVDSVSRLIAYGNHEKLIAECAKCDVRCRNCHRIVTHYTRKGKPIPVVHKPSDTESKDTLIDDTNLEDFMVLDEDGDDAKEILAEFGGYMSDDEKKETGSNDEDDGDNGEDGEEGTDSEEDGDRGSDDKEDEID